MAAVDSKGNIREPAEGLPVEQRLQPVREKGQRQSPGIQAQQRQPELGKEDHRDHPKQGRRSTKRERARKPEAVEVKRSQQLVGDTAGTDVLEAASWSPFVHPREHLLDRRKLDDKITHAGPGGKLGNELGHAAAHIENEPSPLD